MYDCIIIGAGMSGLAAGIRLAHFGKKVVILERHAIPGGLNSHYSKDGRRFDVGLHAMTNFVPRGTKGAPLSKLLRQLRIDHNELDLVEQGFSSIDFPGRKIRWTNGMGMMVDEVAREFPTQVDGFRRLVAHVQGYEDTALDAPYLSSREVVAGFISDPTLIDMIFCPVMYYGSAVEDDMDFSQFCIMFKAVFSEGFCRPQIGVRHLLRLLQHRVKEAGAEVKMRTGVKRILLKDGVATGVELDNGEVLEGKAVLSSAGVVETSMLLGETPKQRPGMLSFVETLLVLDTMPKDLGIDETISFYCRSERFNYRRPAGRTVDPSSGVICIPNNFQFRDKPLAEGIIRFTCLADYEAWSILNKPEYAQAKKDFIRAQMETTGLASKLDGHIVYEDAFSPLTVKKFTSHVNGAIYGSPDKIKDGRTSAPNVFLCGTDQGFLGIIAALLSGISMSNFHLMK